MQSITESQKTKKSKRDTSNDFEELRPSAKKIKKETTAPVKREFGDKHYIINVFYDNEKLSDKYFKNEFCDQSMSVDDKKTSAMMKIREIVRGKGGLTESLLLPRIYNDYYEPVSSEVRSYINKLNSLEDDFKKDFKGKYTYEKFMNSDLYKNEINNFFDPKKNKNTSPEKKEVFNKFLNNGCSLKDVHTFFSYVKNISTKSSGGREDTYA